jgi:hypothetical protein
VQCFSVRQIEDVLVSQRISLAEREDNVIDEVRVATGLQFDVVLENERLDCRVELKFTTKKSWTISPNSATVA